MQIRCCQYRGGSDVNKAGEPKKAPVLLMNSRELYQLMDGTPEQAKPARPEPETSATSSAGGKTPLLESAVTIRVL